MIYLNPNPNPDPTMQQMTCSQIRLAVIPEAVALIVVVKEAVITHGQAPLLILFVIL